MRKISSVIFLPFFIILLLIKPAYSYSLSVVWEPDAETSAGKLNFISKITDKKVWEYLGNNIYYNKTNITKSSNIMSVWTYRIIPDDEKKDMVEFINKYDLERSTKYQNWDHNMVLIELDCKNKLWKHKKLMLYDDKENILNYDISDSEWRSNIPNSVYEKLYQKVCVKQTLKKK
jgi:hypothetical protein